MTDTAPVAQPYFFQYLLLATISGLSACNGASAPSSDSAPASLQAVQNLRATVYTNTAIELFWDRADASAGITTYNIMRDGIFLDRRDGTSYFDSGLTPATAYTYSVASVNDADKQGPSIELALLTLPDEPELTVAKSAQLVPYLLSIVNETRLEQWVESVKPAVGGVTTTGTDNGDFTRYECVDGGTAILRPYGRAQAGGTTTEYATCRSPQSHRYPQIDGNYSTSYASSMLAGNPGLFEGRDYNLTAANAEGFELRIDGVDGRFEGENSSTATRDLNLSSGAYAGTTTISATLNMVDGRGYGSQSDTYARELQGQFSVQSPQTGNRLLVGSFATPLKSSLAGACYEQGEILVQAVDGGQLTINFNTGNAAIFDVVIGNGDQQTHYSMKWSDAFGTLTPTQRASGLISAVC